MLGLSTLLGRGFLDHFLHTVPRLHPFSRAPQSIPVTTVSPGRIRLVVPPSQYRHYSIPWSHPFGSDPQSIPVTTVFPGCVCSVVTLSQYQSLHYPYEARCIKHCSSRVERHHLKATFPIYSWGMWTKEINGPFGPE